MEREPAERAKSAKAGMSPMMSILFIRQNLSQLAEEDVRKRVSAGDAASLVPIYEDSRSQTMASCCQAVDHKRHTTIVSSGVRKLQAPHIAEVLCVVGN